MREVLAARFTRVLGTLLLNGVALITALAIVRDAVGNRAGAAAVERASLSARGGGGSLTRNWRPPRCFPPRTIHLLRLGEETAQLAAMALRAADIHEERTRLATQRLIVAAGAGDDHPHGPCRRRHRRIADDGDAQPERPGLGMTMAMPGSPCWK